MVGELLASEAAPLISVIMPCYNAARFVEEAVASVMGQTYPAVELIVIDDGSDDRSVEILKSLAARYAPRMKLLFASRLGPYPCRNLGLAQARGSRIAFLDADDYWTPDALEKLNVALDQACADLAYSGWQNLGAGAPGQNPHVPPKYEDGDMAEAFLRSCPWPIHAALVQRGVIDAVHGFSERRFSSMDYDLWLRILARTRRMVRVPEVLAFYRWHGMQISTNRWRQVLDALQARKDFIVHHPDLVAHMAPHKLTELTDGHLIKEAYRAYWKRDLHTALMLFRRAFLRRAWRVGDLKYILPSLFPEPIYRFLVQSVDRERSQ